VLTAFLHKQKQIVQEFFAFRIIAEFVQLLRDSERTMGDRLVYVCKCSSKKKGEQKLPIAQQSIKQNGKRFDKQKVAEKERNKQEKKNN
jgi:hypothetical protein